MEVKRFGDSALIIEFGDRISREVNAHVMSCYRHFKQHKKEGITDLIPAYNSISIIYNPAIISFPELQNHIKKIDFKVEDFNYHVAKIPVCYDMSRDQDDFCRFSNLTWNEIIELHTQVDYHIYMMGFLPGFLYMGEVDERIRLPRKQEPRKSIGAGSVGIAGTQTGIYPMSSPGGWNILGRTPVSLFDPYGERPFPIEVGETVQFYSISKLEFETISKDKNHMIERVDARE